jgi:hypothetical protein
MHKGTANKERQEENSRDLGVVEWRIPVGRAERAGERQNGGQKERSCADEEWDRRDQERTDKRGNTFSEEGSERTPSSHITALCVQSGQLCVCVVGDGWVA